MKKVQNSIDTLRALSEVLQILRELRDRPRGEIREALKLLETVNPDLVHWAIFGLGDLFSDQN